MGISMTPSAELRIYIAAWAEEGPTPCQSFRFEMQPSHGSAPLYPSIENEPTACSAAGQLMGAEWPGSLKEPQCTISCPLRKSGGNQQQKAENFNSNIQSPENFVIVSNLKQLCQCGWSTPFDRVNILLFPILMFFRFSTCK